MNDDELEAAIAACVHRAPPLTNAQRLTLAELLRPVRVDGRIMIDNIAAVA